MNRSTVTDILGDVLGIIVDGIFVGVIVDEISVGIMLESSDDVYVGDTDGTFDGLLLGEIVGNALGSLVGFMDALFVGTVVFEGAMDG